MTVIAVDRDLAALTLTIVSEFGAPVERVWQVWADPRQLERWWGPPNYPATVVDRDNLNDVSRPSCAATQVSVAPRMSKARSSTTRDRDNLPIFRYIERHARCDQLVTR